MALPRAGGHWSWGDLRKEGREPWSGAGWLEWIPGLPLPKLECFPVPKQWLGASPTLCLPFLPLWLQL